MEWTFTLPKELSFWKLESLWIFESSKNNCRGQNSMDQGFHYTIGNILEHRCLKWARMTHLDTSNISYGQKKGQESNWQFDSRPLKVRNRPNFLMFRWHATYRWKALDKGYKFLLNLILIKGLQAKLWIPKVARVLIVRISGLPLGSPGTKWHLGVGLVSKHKVYYKGEGGGFPQVRAVLNFVSPSLPVARPNTKVLQLCTNQLVVWFCTCPCEWVIICHSF
jgi:hypothetical protein